MSKKKKPKTFSRRDFIKVSAGAVVAAGVGCGTKDEPLPPGTGGQFPGPGGAGAGMSGSGVPGGSGGDAPSAGSGPMVTGGTPVSGQGGGPTGGTMPPSGGAPGSGGMPAGAGGGEAGTGPAGTGGGVAGGPAGTGGGVAGGPAGTGGGEAGVGGVSGSGGTGGGEAPLVALVRDTDWAKATRDAIELAGGLPDLSGKTVLLKPNIITSNPHPETTNVEVIRGAIQAVKAKNAARIIVGEDGFGTTGMAAMTALGITTICQSEGAEAMSLAGGATEYVSANGATNWPIGIPIYQAVLDADYVINMPVCKTHGIAGFSLAMKAWYGIVPRGSYQLGVDIRDHTQRNIGPKLAELHLGKQEDFIILDASKAIVTGGPTMSLGASTADPNIVVASRDAIAADVTGLCILKQFGPDNVTGVVGTVYRTGVWEQAQIARALQLAFPGWISSPQAFSYDQIGVDEHAEIMARRNV